MQQPPQFQAQQGQPGVVYVQQPPQPNYIIQNVPPPQDGCCGGLSEKYNTAGGLGTGIIQLVIGILCVIMSAASYTVPSLIYTPYGVWSGVIFYIPTGILGIFSKNKSTGVITGYLVMGILSALEAFGMLVFEAFWAWLWSYDLSCTAYCGSFLYDCEQFCRSEASTAIHAVLAILALIEFIVSIVGAVYCCGGLRCCCASPSTATTAIHYQNQPQQVVVTEPYQQGKM